MAPGSILMLALGRLEGPGWAPGPVVQLCIPNSTAQTQLLLLHPESRGCCSRGISAEPPPALISSFSSHLHHLSQEEMGVGRTTSAPTLHSLKAVRESRVSTKILSLDPASGVFWAQSGSSALPPLCLPHHLLPAFTPHLISYFTLGEPYLEKSFQALSRPRLCSEGVGTPGTSLVTSSWSSEAQKTLKPLLSGAWWEFLSQQPLAWRWQRGGGCGSFQVITVG